MRPTAQWYEANPEFDGPYLAYVQTQNPCENKTYAQRVVTCHMNQWIVLPTDTVLFWTHLPHSPTDKTITPII